MIRVAVIQMVSTADIETNLQTAADLIQQAVTDHGEFLVLPENFPLMGHQEHDKIAILEPQGEGPIQNFLKNQAKQYGIWFACSIILLVNVSHAMTKCIYLMSLLTVVVTKPITNQEQLNPAIKLL
jgi:nitrilase